MTTPTSNSQLREAIAKAVADLPMGLGDTVPAQFTADAILTAISPLVEEMQKERPPVGADSFKGDGKARYYVVARSTAFTYAAYCAGNSGRSVNVAADSVQEFIAAAKELGLEPLDVTDAARASSKGTAS